MKGTLLTTHNITKEELKEILSTCDMYGDPDYAKIANTLFVIYGMGGGIKIETPTLTVRECTNTDDLDVFYNGENIDFYECVNYSDDDFERMKTLLDSGVKFGENTFLTEDDDLYDHYRSCNGCYESYVNDIYDEVWNEIVNDLECTETLDQYNSDTIYLFAKPNTKFIDVREERVVSFINTYEIHTDQMAGSHTMFWETLKRHIALLDFPNSNFVTDTINALAECMVSIHYKPVFEGDDFLYYITELNELTTEIDE